MCNLLLLIIFEIASSSTEVLKYTLVSDTNTWVVSVNVPNGGPSFEVLPALMYGTWVNIPGSHWIWDGDNSDLITAVFTKIFYLYCQVNSITLIVSADDNLQTLFNNQDDSCSRNGLYASTLTCSIGSFAVQGLNNLTFIVTNSGLDAGLLYQLNIQFRYDPASYSGNCICEYINYYWDDANSDCELCHESCYNCTGPLKTNCISCLTGYYLSESSSCLSCNQDCVACNQSNICLNCIALNSSPNKDMGCSCNSGYYNSTPLSSISGCLLCYSDCETCNNSHTCKACKDPNSIPSSILGCECIENYYRDSNHKCTPCPSSCVNGCIDASHCKICKDSGCEVCIGKNLDYCTKCYEKYILAHGNCIYCTPNEYFNKIDNSCYPCNKTCLTCSNLYECTSCYSFSALDSNHACVCDLGYYGNADQCIRKLFSALYTINSKNVVTIIFTEPLQSYLTEQDIQIMINNTQQNYKIINITIDSYEIDIEFVENYGVNYTLYIKFVKTMTSSTNSLLYNQVLEINLYSPEDNSEINKINDAKAKATKGATIGLSFVFGNSFITFDPTSLFSFLNTAELFSIFFLFNLPIESALSAFFYSLKIEKLLPNALDAIFDKNLGKKLPENYSKFGMETNLILISSGVGLSILMLYIVLYGFLKLIKFFLPRLNKITDLLLKSFEYRVFLRFWIQSYQDILFNFIIEITYNDFGNWLLIVDFIVAIFLMIFQVLVFCTLVWVIYKRSTLYKHQVENFASKYGTFFSQFKSKEISCLLYYFLFILRRTGLVLLAMYSPDVYLSLIASYTFSVTVMVYVIVAMPFENFIYNMYNILNEILISGVHVIIFCSFISEFNMSKTYTTDMCVNFIFTAWILNMVSSVLGPVYQVIINFIEKRKSLSVGLWSRAPHSSIDEFVENYKSLGKFDNEGSPENSPKEDGPNYLAETYQMLNVPKVDGENLPDNLPKE